MPTYSGDHKIYVGLTIVRFSIIIYAYVYDYCSYYNYYVITYVPLLILEYRI